MLHATVGMYKAACLWHDSWCRQSCRWWAWLPNCCCTDWHWMLPCCCHLTSRQPLQYLKLICICIHRRMHRCCGPCCEISQPGLHLLQHIPYKVMDYWQTPGDDMKLLLGYYSLGGHPTNLKLAVERIILAEHSFGRFSTQVSLARAWCQIGRLQVM